MKVTTEAVSGISAVMKESAVIMDMGRTAPTAPSPPFGTGRGARGELGEDRAEFDLPRIISKKEL